MSLPDDPGLEERVARLERQVERLLAQSPPRTEARPEAASSPPHGGAPPGSARPRVEERPPGGPERRTKDGPAGPPPLAAEGEKWLGRVGVGFVILAFAFLLKLSFDRGWITPALRLAAGFVTGAALIGVGLRLEAGRRRLAQALLGGGIALLYLVGFAGSQLYDLLPVWVALSLMTTTTVLAIVLAERQDAPVLSIIGVIGGLATPFLLEVAGAHAAGVAVYASLVLVGAAPVQFQKGWPALLVTLAVTGAMVVGGLSLPGGPSALAVPFVALVGLYWMATVPSPILRPVFRSSGRGREEIWLTRLVAAWATAVVALGLAVHLGLSRPESGAMLLLLGLLTGGLARVARGVPRAQAPAYEVAALTVAVGLTLLTWSSLGLLLVMAEVSLLLVLAERTSLPSVARVAHWLGVAVAVAFLLDAQYADPDGFLGLREGALLRVGVLGLAVASALWARELAGVYKGAAYAGLLVWFLSELAPRPNGQALISIAWAVQGTAALLASMARKSRTLQVAGLATLGLVAGKLLLLDLSQLDPIWRILLFLGFGATLLGLGYLVNRPDTEHVSR